MSAGVAKLQLLIDLKNNLKAGLDGAKKHVEKACGDMQGKLDSFKTKGIEAFQSLKDEIPGLGKAIQLLSNPVALIVAGLLAIGTAFVKCVKSANDWWEQMAQINVTAELTKTELQGLSDKLLEIGGRNVAPLEEVPKAFNRIISAGLSVNQSLEALEPTLRAAKAGFTDIETVASAAVSTMMSSGENVNKVYDVLFATVKEGNAEFKDIAQYLPKVIPLARNVGFALDETAGAYASLTGKLSAEASTTALQGIMRALSDQRIAIGEMDKTTGKYVSGFKSIGVDVFDPATKKIRPMLDIIKDIEKQMSGLSDQERMLKFDKLGLDQMGTLGFSTLMQDVQGLEKAINATVNSQGALEKAYADSLTPMETWKTVINQIKVGIIKIGELFLPIVSTIGQKVLDVINYFRNLTIENQLLKDLISGISAVFSFLWEIVKGAVGFIITGLKVIWGIVKFVWDVLEFIHIVFTGIGRKIASAITQTKAWQVFTSAIAKLFEWIGDIIGWIKDKINYIYENYIKPIVEDIISAINSVKDFFSEEKTVSIKVKTIKPGNEPEKPTPTDEPTLPIPTDKSTYTPKGNGSDDAKAIRGGSQTKNTTINIDSFVKGFTPTHQSVNGMNKDELERWLTEMFMRVVRSAETAM